MGNDPHTTEHKIDEIADRTRRIETRITKYIESQGVDTGVRRPTWSRGDVSVPSLDTSLRDILAAIPDGYPNDVPVYHKQAKIATIPPITRGVKGG